MQISGVTKVLLRSLLRSRASRGILRRNPVLSSQVMRLARTLSGERSNTGWSNQARYCYAVWLRHLVMAERYGLNTDPRVIVELGPGDALGIGLCGMLCGADALYALDAFPYATIDHTLAVLDGLTVLLRRRATIPSAHEYPEVEPSVGSTDFPSSILTDHRLDRALDVERQRKLRAAITAGMDGSDHGGVSVRYQAPWRDASIVNEDAADIVISQAVMEHVRDLESSYAAMARWLAPKGHLSHQIDFRSHDTSPDLNGQWIYPEPVWRQLENEKVYRWINRQPCSTHLALVERNGLQPVATVRVESSDGIRRKHVSSQWRHLSDSDLNCCGALILATRA